MTYLSADEKDDAQQQVADAMTIADVEQSVTEATDQNLANAKDWANGAIAGLANLDADMKQSFDNQVSVAETTSAIEQIVADAQAADKLADQKSDGQVEIDNMTYLTDDEKSAYNQQISDATDIAGLTPWLMTQLTKIWPMPKKQRRLRLVT